jgi:hypothetical protein
MVSVLRYKRVASCSKVLRYGEEIRGVTGTWVWGVDVFSFFGPQLTPYRSKQ